MANQTLYRQQAIDAQRQHLFGNVVISQTRLTSVVSGILFLMVLCFFALLMYGSYARRERVTGYLVPDKGIVKIFAPTNGLLINVNVIEGQLVSANELLFTISTTHNTAGGSDLETELISKLRSQKKLLLEKIKQQLILSNQKTLATKQQIIGIENEFLQLGKSISLENKQSEQFLDQTKKMQQLYAKGHISESRFQDANQRYINSKVNIANSHRLSISLTNQKVILEQRAKQLPIELNNISIDLNNSISDLEQRIIELSGRRNYRIRAPISGRATALQVSIGQQLNKQLSLVTILPDKSVLQAELFLPTRAAGFINSGQDVFLRYDAFPYQHYGLHKGSVSHVVKAIITPNEIPLPLGINEPVYRVQVKLETQQVSAFDKKFPLQAGMILNADIVLENRSLFQWILEPLYRLAGY